MIRNLIYGKRIILFIIREIFFLAPFYFIAAIALTNIWFFLDTKYNNEQYKIFTTFIAISIALSSLSLRASSACDDIEKRKIFY